VEIIDHLDQAVRDLQSQMLGLIEKRFAQLAANIDASRPGRDREEANSGLRSSGTTMMTRPSSTRQTRSVVTA
jgi:hypothetical protein